MIEPTVGRILYLWPSASEKARNGEPIAAIVSAVVNDSRVTVTAFPASGPRVYENIQLVHPDDTYPVAGPFCEWMPYQIGQAAKTEELQAKLDKNNG